MSEAQGIVQKLHERGLSLSAIATMTGVHRQSISAIFNGHQSGRNSLSALRSFERTYTQAYKGKSNPPRKPARAIGSKSTSAAPSKIVDAEYRVLSTDDDARYREDIAQLKQVRGLIKPQAYAKRLREIEAERNHIFIPDDKPIDQTPRDKEYLGGLIVLPARTAPRAEPTRNRRNAYPPPNTLLGLVYALAKAWQPRALNSTQRLSLGNSGVIPQPSRLLPAPGASHRDPAQAINSGGLQLTTRGSLTQNAQRGHSTPDLNRPTPPMPGTSGLYVGFPTPKGGTL